jgi:putative protein-disulfide isomerase
LAGILGFFDRKGPFLFNPNSPHAEAVDNDSPIMATVYFFHDPMCSWCWGYRPTEEQLFRNLPENVRRVNILGGLAPDSDDPMPENLRQQLPAAWRQIHEMLGTEFNFNFWTDCEPRRSTYPACRAVLAAGLQNQYNEMVDAIQRAYYLRAMNPSDLSTLEALAGELGLDSAKFANDIRSTEVNNQLMQQVAVTRQSPVQGLPSLILKTAGFHQALTLDYRNYQTTLGEIEDLID